MDSSRFPLAMETREIGPSLRITSITIALFTFFIVLALPVVIIISQYLSKLTFVIR